MSDSIHHQAPPREVHWWPWTRKPLPKSKGHGGKARHPARSHRHSRSVHKKMLQAFQAY